MPPVFLADRRPASLAPVTQRLEKLVNVPSVPRFPQVFQVFPCPQVFPQVSPRFLAERITAARASGKLEVAGPRR